MDAPGKEKDRLIRGGLIDDMYFMDKPITLIFLTDPRGICRMLSVLLLFSYRLPHPPEPA